MDDIEKIANDVVNEMISEIEKKTVCIWCQKYTINKSEIAGKMEYFCRICSFNYYLQLRLKDRMMNGS